MQNTVINYRQIFKDILEKLYPEKKNICKILLSKKHLYAIDILELNKKIFENPDKETESQNQRHRSYSKSDILKILDYQKEHRLNNSQLANHFKLSRNSVTKWKKVFLT